MTARAQNHTDGYAASISRIFIGLLATLLIIRLPNEAISIRGFVIAFFSLTAIGILMFLASIMLSPYVPPFVSLFGMLVAILLVRILVGKRLRSRDRTTARNTTRSV